MSRNFSKTVMMQAIGQMWKELDEKEKVTAVLNVIRLILILLQAPYEKKAEAAKKKYAEEMAAYEASK